MSASNFVQVICKCPQDTVGAPMHAPDCWLAAPPRYEIVHGAADHVSETITVKRIGWRCPVCGGGNAPTVTRCPCTPTLVVWMPA